MGIPHLTAQIKPFAKQISWNITSDHTTKEKENPQDLVIDGPSLAYHIHHQCLTTHLNARHALDTIPTYRELGAATIAWLEKMETFGLCVKHIFFDGYLPQSKTGVRNDRLSKYLLQLKAFRSSIVSFSASDSSYGVDRPRISKHKALPAAPFLVPCVMDALFASKYSNRTRSVPCEAEAQCTHKSNLEPNNIILTSDSDMLLLANSNRVIFLADITITSQRELDDTCCAEYYKPAEICTKLGCPNFIELAFFLSIHPHRTLKELAKQAATNGYSPLGYEDFRAQFLPENQYSKFASSRLLKESSQLANVTDHLDPRIAELAQQWCSDLEDTTSTTDTNTGSGTVTRHMYLPFLLDDPTRASAWRPSLPIRTLAYSLFTLLLKFNSIHSVNIKMLEADRRGDRILDVQIPLLESADAIAEACSTLLASLSLSQATTTELVSSAEDSWKLLALSNLLTALHTAGTAVPSRTEVCDICFSASSPHTQQREWPDVHLSAQVEAYIYSLRILSQTLSLILAFPASRRHDPPLITHRRVFHDLSQKLRDMPPLDKLIHKAGAGLTLQTSDGNREAVERLLGIWYGEQGKHGVVEMGKRRKKRGSEEKVDRKKKFVGMQMARAKGVNMFSLLDDDGDDDA